MSGKNYRIVEELRARGETVAADIIETLANAVVHARIFIDHECTYKGHPREPFLLINDALNKLKNAATPIAAKKYPIVEELHGLSRELAGVDGELGGKFTLPNKAGDIIETLAEAAEELTSACEADFTSLATESGDCPCLNDETVSFGDSRLLFGHIRKTRAALAKLKGET